MGNEEYDKQKESERMNQQAQCNMAGGAPGGVVGLSEPKRDNLRNRVERQMCDAARAGRKAERLAELGMLLDRYPGVARILDLIEEVRG